MTIVGMIRHGSTEWNKLGKMQGQIDTLLTEEGRQQAIQLGHRLKNEDWNFILSSDLSRAKETAMTISEISGIPIAGFDVRLRERSFGLVEGTTQQERLERYGPDWKELDLGGESDAQVWQRWLDVSTELTAQFPKGRVLIVSHGGFIVQVLRSLQLHREEFLENTSLTVLERENEAWKMKLYNCLSHLKGE
jgi:2,3-bisphosphoglycerate-dependent phosphoglycerate mutase